MSTYLIINLAVIIVPVLFSFEKRMKFYKKLPAVIFSLITVGAVYISWDIAAADAGHWSFNNEHTGSIRISGLPIEEIFFFISIPYAILFLYETFRFYLRERFPEKPGREKIYFFASIILIVCSFMMYDSSYTFVALFFSGLFFLISSFNTIVINSNIYRIFIIFSFIPFFIVNYILTSLPVVEYSSEAVTGIRIATIPVEDFFYSFSMISFYTAAYHFFLLQRRKAS